MPLLSPYLSLFLINLIFAKSNESLWVIFAYLLTFSFSKAYGKTYAKMPVERYASEYNMNHAKRGLALVFNHEHFDIPSLKSRTGTNVDCENLCDTLKGLHFEVSMYKDFRSADIQHEIQSGEFNF